MLERPILLTLSEKPLEFDTLSAVKVRHFLGDIEQLYCYARFYCIDGGIAVGIKAFERADIAQGELSLDISSIDRHKRLVIGISYQRDAYAKVLSGCEKKEDTLLNVNFISGDDNQGFYWGAEFFIDKKLLDSVDISASSGKTFLGNLTLTSQGSEGKGTAFSDDYGDFLVVPY